MTYVSLPHQSTNFKLFPNPVKDHLQIHYPTKDDIHIRIIDQLGRCLYSEYLANQDHVFSLSTKGIPSGTYYLIINNGVYHRRFTKE